MTTKISGKKRKKSNRSICPGIVHPRPVMTFRALNTFSGHPLPDVTIKSEGKSLGKPCWICSVRRMKLFPNTPPCNLLRRYLSLRKDLSSRMCFEEALLLHLHRVFRPLLTLAAAQTFRWHLVAGSRQPVIQTEINESCLLYYRIENKLPLSLPVTCLHWKKWKTEGNGYDLSIIKG